MKNEKVESWSWTNKLAPFEIKWHCDYDCKQNGCPGHTLKCRLNSVVDIINIDFGDGVEICLPMDKMSLILHIAKKFTE